MAALVGGSYSSKAPMKNIRQDVKEKIEAAQADTVETEERRSSCSKTPRGCVAPRYNSTVDR